jgi:CheY-like chemotaxis protein
MMPAAGAITILYADDDPDDRDLMRDALDEIGLGGDLRFVEDGEEAMEYLRHEGRYADPRSAPEPSFLLLDLNMPRMDGREVLTAVRSDARLRTLPVIVLTTSDSEEAVRAAYDIGASSYVVKPPSFEKLVRVMRDLRHYWADVVTLPTSMRW